MLCERDKATSLMKVRLGRSMSGVNVHDDDDTDAFARKKTKSNGSNTVRDKYTTSLVSSEVRKVTVTNVKAARLTDCQS